MKLCPREECPKPTMTIIRKALVRVKRLKLSTPYELSAIDRGAVVRIERIRALEEAVVARMNWEKKRSKTDYQVSSEGHVIVPLLRKQDNVLDDPQEKER